MTKQPGRAFGSRPPVILMAILTFMACSDGGPGGPPSDGTIGAKGQSIAVNPPLAEILQTGQSIQLHADVRDALGKQVTNPRVTWQALDPSVATVDFGGKVTGMGPGVAEIRGTYAGVSAIATIAVSRPKLNNGNGESVTIYPESDTVPTVGGSKKLLAIGRNNGGQLVGGNKLKWSSSNPDIASVDGDGVVTGQRTGSTSVIVENGSSADTAQVLVAPSDVPVSLVITPAADTIPTVGGTIGLSAKVLNGSGDEIAGADVAWTSLDGAIASVKSGQVTGLKKGVARIVASHKTVADTATVWVEPVIPATSLYVTPETDTIPQVGGTVTLQAQLLDGNGQPLSQPVTWGTMDAAVAVVSTSGVVKGVSSGLARITARYNTLVDTAMIWVAPAPPVPPYTVTVDRETVTVAVDDTVRVKAIVTNSKGVALDTALASWVSLDAGVATVSGSGPIRAVDVKGLAAGTARIVAMYGGVSDTSVVTVTGSGGSGGSSSGGYTTVMSPDPATIPAIGDKVQISWDVWDSAGHEVGKVYPTWTSLDPSIASVPSGPSRVVDVTGMGKGSARIVATWNGTVDTATVLVENAGAARAWVQVTPAADTIQTVGGTVTLSVAVRDTSGNTVSASQASWSTLDPAVATVNGGGVVYGNSKGLARIVAAYSNAADTAVVWVAPAPPPPPGTQLTPSALMPLLGPLVSRDPNPPMSALLNYDNRYKQNEYARFQDYLAVENDPQGAYLNANHYGGLRSRIDWAIRTGEPWGPGVTDESKYGYARGLRIVRRYLQYSQANKFNVPVQNNTGLADIELLYRLEGDPVALTHIHLSAQAYTLDPYDYLKLKNPSSGARIPAVALQAFNAAHRLGIPYAPDPANYGIAIDKSIGSWLEAGERLIGWFDQYNVIQPDGSIYTPSNGGDTYFMDAMLATQLLEWCANVRWNPRAFELARLIMDHLVSELKPGWSSLGYLDSSPSPADDLAAFYIWPSLVMWQETGDSKYYDFAMVNLDAATHAYIYATKQFNQVYSTLGQNLEALVAGVPWR